MCAEEDAASIVNDLSQWDGTYRARPGGGMF